MNVACCHSVHRSFLWLRLIRSCVQVILFDELVWYRNLIPCLMITWECPCYLDKLDFAALSIIQNLFFRVVSEPLDYQTLLAYINIRAIYIILIVCSIVLCLMYFSLILNIFICSRTRSIHFKKLLMLSLIYNRMLLDSHCELMIFSLHQLRVTLLHGLTIIYRCIDELWSAQNKSRSTTIFARYYWGISHFPLHTFLKSALS